MKIVVTGATGYIGDRLTRLAQMRGYDVVAATRRRPTYPGGPWISYDLSTVSSIALPSGTNAVIHMAANTSSAPDISEECEVRSARALIAATTGSNTKFIFVSSQTARSDAPTAYGRIKWRIEQEVLAAGGWVVRPGQVYGANERGLFGTLVGIVRSMPLLPAFLPSPEVQPIHVDDLADALLRIAEREDIPPCTLCLASAEPISFAHFLSVMARCRVRRKRWFIPVPVIFLKMSGAIIGSHMRTRIGLDRLDSLFGLTLMDTAADLMRLNLSLRALPSGMHRSGNGIRRSLLSEGCALLTYLLRVRPGSSLLRRYVRVVEQLRGGVPLELPALILKLPIFVALLESSIDKSASRYTELVWRLDSATTLAEATTYGANRFLGVGRKCGPLFSILWIAGAVVAEIFWRILGAASLLLLQRWLNRPVCRQ